jgi:hypothetical protein
MELARIAVPARVSGGGQRNGKHYAALLVRHFDVSTSFEAVRLAVHPTPDNDLLCGFQGPLACFFLDAKI